MNFGPNAIQRSRGMTLVELLIGLAVVAMIGAVVAVLMTAVAYGTESQREMRQVNTRLHVVATRLTAATRSSRMVLAEGEDYIVLWLADTDANGKPNLSELKRIERDEATDTLLSYKAADDLSSEQDTIYELDSTDFDAATRAKCGSSEFPQTLLASTVTAWDIDLSDSNPQDARLVSYRLTVAINGVQNTLAATASLRNHPETDS